MKKQELNDVLSNNTYPGRGICLGVDESVTTPPNCIK